MSLVSPTDKNASKGVEFLHPSLKTCGSQHQKVSPKWIRRDMKKGITQEVAYIT